MFNIVTAARKIMTYFGEKPNIAVILGILPGTDGVVKMSKSLGNHIPINTNAEDMFGKVMSIPDTAMPSYARLVTRWQPHQIAAMEKEVADGKLHPRDAKMQLAWEITSTFYGDDPAHGAQESFISMFQKKDIPDEMPEYVLKPEQTVMDVLIDSGLVNSRSDARRLVDQKGVKLDGEVISSAGQPFPGGGVLQVGKRHFLRVKA